MKNKDDRNEITTLLTDKGLPVYISPVIITYTSDEILEQIGPAYACSPSPCAVGG